MPSSNFKPESVPDLTGRVYIVTGGNAGIGRAVVVGLASKGARVYMGARSESKANAAIQEIKTQFATAEIYFLHMDLCSLQSVVSAAREFRSRETVLHGLINNAGIMGVPFAMTADGYEIQFQTNYLSHWLLTNHLLPLLQSTGAASVTPGIVRVLNVTSDGHGAFTTEGGINFDDTSLPNKPTMVRYGQSKLAQVLHTKELNRKYGPGSVDASQAILFAAVHPGHIDTDLNKQATGTAPGLVLRGATRIMRLVGILDAQEKGAWSPLFAGASNAFKASDSGAYVVPYAKISAPSKTATDAALAEKLWDWTCKEMDRKQLLHA